MVTLVTLAVFVTVIVPEQKREFELSLESKARGVAVSIRGVAAGAAVSEDYSAVVDQAMQVLSGDTAIDYLVMTKNDGFSIVIDRSAWKTEKLGDAWRPAASTPSAPSASRHCSDAACSSTLFLSTTAGSSGVGFTSVSRWMLTTKA